MTRTSARPLAALSRVLASVSVVFLLACLSAPLAVAQGADADFDAYPLQPADTSSPRATLRSFLTNINEAIEDWRRDADATAPKNYRAYHRARQTLDFSTTPDGDSTLVRSLRLLFLKEILDRIELPPEDEIPGSDEIADGSVREWTIPDTQIRIRRIEDGPRAGEFLFSADTVQRLDRLYRQAKHLPYKPGASSVGIYEAYLASDKTDLARERLLRNRLRPVDKSSPRSTLEGFLDGVNRAYALVMDSEAKLRATPPAMTRDEAREIEEKAANLLERATATLDLSQVPKALRERVGLEAALQLKEILDRMTLPPLESIPDTQMVMAAREKPSTLSSQAGEPIRWRYPNTAIEIVEITEGERQGQFLFSAGSVKRIEDFYAAVRDLPYRSDDYGTLDEQYRSPGKSEGFYEFYASTPGRLIPSAVSWGRWIEDSPDWLKEIYLGQTVWQWIALVLIVLFAALAAYMVFRVTRRWAGRGHAPLNEWLRVLAPIAIAYIVHAAVRLIGDDLNATGSVLAAVTTGGQAVVFALAAWAVYGLCKAVAETIIATPRIQTAGSEASLLRIGARVVGFLIGAWIVIAGIQGLGADLIPLLAGLGVGGLAVALAAQSVVANYIGGLILFANKPVRVGDFCRYGEDPSPGWLRIGTVEDIGLISTRLRGIDRTITTIPNAEFANMHIMNLTVRDRMILKTKIPLRYETTPDQLRLVIASLREMLLAHPRITKEPARVRAGGFGEYSINVEIFAYVGTADWNDFLAVQEDVILRIMDIVKNVGTAFALPSRTLYHTRDGGLDSERQEAAEKQVREWAASQMLPFPEFDDDYRRKVMNTLEYPPAGAPKTKGAGKEFHARDFGE